jgi:predicted O-methyltransferase YrrM
MIGRTALHYAKVMLRMELPRTQTTVAERDLLRRYLPGAKVVVEVGVFEGLTTRLLAQYADHDATVYGVDPFFTGRFGLSWGQKIAVAYNREYLRSGRVKFERALSTEVGDAVPDLVDFTFIDADHSLEAIKEDWEFWSARTRPNGIIALHDTILPDGQPDALEFGSHRHYRDHIQHDSRFEVVGRQDSLSVLKKRQSPVGLFKNSPEN